MTEKPLRKVAGYSMSIRTGGSRPEDVLPFSAIVLSGQVEEVRPAKVAVKKRHPPEYLQHPNGEMIYWYRSEASVYRDTAISVEEVFRSATDILPCSLFYVRRYGGTAYDEEEDVEVSVEIEGIEPVEFTEGEKVLLFLSEDRTTMLFGPPHADVIGRKYLRDENGTFRHQTVYHMPGQERVVSTDILTRKKLLHLLETHPHDL